MEPIRTTDPKLEKDLTEALEWFRAYRYWALSTKKNPWMIRQALVISLEIDTAVLLDQGVDLKALEKADQESKLEAKRLIKAIKKC